eukprot:g7553.t1
MNEIAAMISTNRKSRSSQQLHDLVDPVKREADVKGTELLRNRAATQAQALDHDPERTWPAWARRSWDAIATLIPTPTKSSGFGCACVQVQVVN